MCVASSLCFTGICTALVGVFGRATVFVIVALGGLRLGGDDWLDSFRFGMLLLEGRLARAAFEDDLVEGLVLFLGGRSSLCFEEDFVVELGVEDEGGGTCRREYKNALGVIIMMTSTGSGEDPSLRGSDRGISDGSSKR